MSLFALAVNLDIAKMIDGYENTHAGRVHYVRSLNDNRVNNFYVVVNFTD